MSIIEHFRRKPEYIEAALVQEHTAKEIATWCGGQVGREQDRGVDSYLELTVPNVDGNLKARVNSYVVRNEEGRFTVMTAAEMVSKGYETFAQSVEALEADARLKAVGSDDFKPDESFKPLTPHYVPRGRHPFGN